MGRPKRRLAGLKTANVNKSQSSQSNTTNTAANQSSNANNPPPNVLPQPTELLSNQNLQNSAASAAALPLLQQINCLP